MVDNLKRFAFTLIEVLVVIAVVVLLGGITFPVFQSAKHQAKASAGKSYLRDQYVLVLLYSQEYDNVLPAYDAVKSAPQLHAPCSPADTWLTPCWSRQKPMLGSFGYGPAAFEESRPNFETSDKPVPLFADIFAAKYRVGEFSGYMPSDVIGCARAGTCEFPELVWFAYSDGSLRSQRNPDPPEPFTTTRTRELFAWPSAFRREFERIEKS